MNFEEIYKAARDGRTFRFIGKINELSYENGNLKIDWVFPDAGKPFNMNHDFTYIELAPKYDPCRPFKKGDMVTPRERNGRLIAAAKPLLRYKNYVVTRDEKTNCLIYFSDGEDEYAIDPAYLELVTPVEELDFYRVVDAHTHWDVTDKDMKTVAIYSKGLHPNAKAVAELDRMNEEYRKGQNND